MTTGFSIEKWELQRTTLDTIAEYGRVRYEEKEMRWLITNYLEDAENLLTEKEGKSEIREVLDKLPKADFIFITKPECIFEKLSFIHPIEYIRVVIKKFGESKEKLLDCAENFKTALHIVSEKGETVYCTQRIFFALIIAILSGTITSDDVKLLKCIEAPKERENEFKRMEKNLINGNTKRIYSLFLMEEEGNRVTF